MAKALAAAGGKRTEGHALIDLDIFSDFRRLTDYNAGTVVDEEIFANRGTRVDIYTGEAVGILGHHTWNQRHTEKEEFVSQAVHKDRVETRVGKDDLIRIVGCRVAVVACLDVGHQHLPDGRNPGQELIYQRSGLLQGCLGACRRIFFPVLQGDDKFRDANPYYNVYVLKDRRWQTVEVRNALCSDSPNHHEEIWNDWDNSKKLRDTMCYALFTHDFADAVRVKVEKRSGFSRVAVRPSAYGITTKESASSNTVEFTLPAYEKRKVSVEFDGDRYHNLFLMPSRPDTRKPAVSGGNVSYYGPGEHTEGIIVLTEGQTLYVDEGAVLYPQNIQVRGNGVTIAGRGVISGEKMRHWGEEFSNADVMIDVQGNKHEGGYTDFRIEGVTMIDAPSWCLRVMNTDNVAIENINMIHWDLNGDGIDLCTVTGATINDCMLRAYDDCITLKVRSNADPYGNVHDIRITNCIIWGDYARGIVVGPECGNVWWASGDIRNIEIRNCTVLEAARGQALAIMQELGDFSEAGGPALIDNVLFEDCVVDNIHSSGTPIYTSQVNKGESCEMKNVVFRNVTILDGLGCQPSQVNVNNTYTSIDFDNLIYNSRKITSFGKEIVLKDASSEPWEHTWISFK